MSRLASHRLNRHDHALNSLPPTRSAVFYPCCSIRQRPMLPRHVAPQQLGNAAHQTYKLALTGCTSGYHVPGRRVHCAASSTASGAGAESTQQNEHVGATLSSQVFQCLQAAQQDALAAGFTATEPSHIMLACLQHDKCKVLRAELEGLGIHNQEVRAVMQVGLLIVQHECNDESACTPTRHLSKASLELLRSSMEYAVQQGSDAVQLGHLLHCMASSSDAVCTKANPVAYMAYQFCGPLSMDKVAGMWLQKASELLQEVPCEPSFLPPQVREMANKFIRKAVPAINTTTDIIKLAETYNRLAWVPNATVSTLIWEKILSLNIEDLSTNEAQQLLAQLQYVPLPPVLEENRQDVALRLGLLMCRCSGDTMYPCTYKPFALGDLRLAVKLSATFPSSLTELCCPFTWFSVIIEWTRGDIKNKYHSILKMVLEQNNGSVTDAAGEALYCLSNPQQYVQPLDANPEQTALEHLANILQELLEHWHDSDHRMTTADKQTFRLLLSSVLQLSLHVSSLPKRVLNTLYSALRASAQTQTALPSAVWHNLLQVTARHSSQLYVSDVDGVLSILDNHLGYTWDCSAKDLVGRLSLILENPEIPYTSKPLAKQWLWSDVSRALPFADMKTAAELTSLAMQLNLPAGETVELPKNNLVDMIEKQSNDIRDVPSYLSLVVTAVQLDEIATDGSCIPAKAQSRTGTAIFKTAASSAHEAVAYGKQTTGKSAAVSSALQALDLSCHDIHAYIARQVLAEHPPTLAVPSCCWEPVTASMSRSETVKGLLESEVDQVHTKVMQAFRAGQMDQHEAVAWMCLKTNPMDMSPKQLASSLSVMALLLDSNISAKEQVHHSPSEMLRRWLRKAEQSLVTQFQPADVDGYIGDQLVTATVALTAISSGNLDISHIPATLLPNAFISNEAMVYLWVLSASWKPNSNERLPPSADLIFKATPRNLASPPYFVSNQLSCLLLLSAAAQFQATSRTTAHQTQLLEQLVFISTAAALMRVWKMSSDGSGNQLKDLSDYDMLLVAALLREIVNAGLPAGMPESADPALAVRLVHEEMEWRVAVYDSSVSAAPASSGTSSSPAASKATKSVRGPSVVGSRTWSVVSHRLKTCL